ncbi:beta-N-acetylhexosaminidase [Aestuariirhabdus sp. Z084]|uniref:beta-N-acetylhexosaminidase n=1 Tax=Aestuariirhabdus haliotis TaxID=2918751 RepID=UPI00201B3899|nr:beta-N-acetylhexosaminidase [Aestuariirhabdus haliotis]MCL6414758.1 beta-N-acetylhexosaminidase [Aestuariirhabdus haliotis]MCL6418690.1 beta-N-acetylhexosaminidase [Aestuariirhabdus haliotis]
MLDLEGTSLTEQESELLQRPACGGVILFTRNFSSRAQIVELTDSIRTIQSDLLIAVDHEGGRVQRFRDGFTRIPAMGCFEQHYLRNKPATLQLVEDVGWLLAAELLACGIDFSFTPVLDLDFKRSDVIGDRAFSSNPEHVADLAGALIRGMHGAGMVSTGKHFPGHGWVVADSHVAVPRDERDFEAILSQDLKPFMALCEQGLDAVMPAHVIYEKVDALPAGFSPYWLQNVLRTQLEFDGVIFSDDLSMEGASTAGNYAERARSALAAGCDMVLVCNNPDGAREVLEFLERDEVEPSHRLASLRGNLSSKRDVERQQRVIAELDKL